MEIQDKEKLKLELLKIDNDFAQQSLDLSTKVIDEELNKIKQKHQRKLEQGTLLDEQIVQQENERLATLEEAEKLANEKKYAEGIINYETFLDNIDIIDQENKTKKEELEIAYKEQKKEAELLDFQNDLEILQLRGEDTYNLKLQQLEKERLAEIKNAEDKGAAIDKINQKFALKTKKLEEKQTKGSLKTEQTKLTHKLEMANHMFQNMRSLASEETIVGKAVAIGGIIANTALGIQKAWVEGGSIWGPILAGTIAATGALGIAKVSGISEKFEKGGRIKIGGKPHSQGGTKFYGEDGTRFEAQKDEDLFILNTEASNKYAGLLSAINQSTGGVAFSSAPTSFLSQGGRIDRTPTTLNNNQYTLNMDDLAEKIGDKFNDAIQQLPTPIIDVEEFTSVQEEVNSIKSDAVL